MARTAHPLKRTAKGSSSGSRKKRLRKTPQLDSIGIEVKCNQLTCTVLSINRRCCDEAVEILKTRLTEKLTAESVDEIRHLRIATPGHHSDLIDFFGFLNIQITSLEVATSIKSLDADDWVSAAFSLAKLDSVKLILNEVNLEHTDIVKAIVDPSLVLRKASIELRVEDSLLFGLGPISSYYIDESLITNEYLLEIAKKMKQEIELDFSSTLLSVEGILAVAEVIGEREDAARLRFQLDNTRWTAREFKAEILKKWGLTEVIQREFKELDEPRTAPLVYKQYTLYNEGCENLCVFDGRIVLKMPTEFVIDGRLENQSNHPHRFTIERVIDTNKQLALDRGFFEVKHC